MVPGRDEEGSGSLKSANERGDLDSVEDISRLPRRVTVEKGRDGFGVGNNTRGAG